MMIQSKKLLAISVLATSMAFFTAAANVAQAGLIGFTLVISGDTNVPTMSWTNNSTTAKITSIDITIGDTGYNYDFAQNIIDPSGGSSTLITPDTVNGGGVRSDHANFTYTGFDPGETASFDLDIDIDSADSVEDYRTVLFNNGGAANAVATVAFMDGSSMGSLMLTLPDGADDLSSYTFRAEANDIPEPGTLALFGLGLAGLGFARRSKAV